MCTSRPGVLKTSEAKALQLDFGLVCSHCSLAFTYLNIDKMAREERLQAKSTLCM